MKRNGLKGHGEQETNVSVALIAELVKLRKSRKFNQEEVARAIGVTQGSVSQMESLKTDMSVETALRYARAIGADIVLNHEGPTRIKKPQ